MIAPTPETLGSYEVLAELDAGGMGEVLIARKRAVGGFERLVALKTVRRDLSGLEMVRDMFLDEARLLARLHHPNIAQVYDFGEDADRLFLAMEYVAGVPFADLAGPGLPPPIACAAMAEALRGLHAAHELTDLDGAPLGVVHRDVSPGNLMLTFEGAVKVLDFGIAVMRGRRAPVTEFGTLKGKPPYMAPEQLRSEALDRRSDVFSAAAVLWELLVGERLFAGDSVFSIARAIEMEDPPPPSARRAGLPAGLDEVVSRGLAKRAEDRYPTALAMAEDLELIASAAGAERLVEFAARELGEARAEHDGRIADLLRHRSKPAPAGRGTGVMTAVDAPLRPAAPPAREPRPEPPSELGTAAGPAPRRRLLPAAIVLLFLLAAAGLVGFTVLARGDTLVAGLQAPPPPPSVDAAAAAVSADAAPPPVIDAGAPAAADAAPPPVPRHRHHAARPAKAPRRDAGAARPPPREPTGVGELTILADGRYAKVHIDGHDRGQTPLFRLELPAGKHEVVWYEPDSGAVRKRQLVTVKAGALRKLRAR